MRVFVNFSPVLLLQKLRPGFKILLGFLEDCKWLMMLLGGTKRIIDCLFADRSVPGLPTRRRGPGGQSVIPRPLRGFARRSRTRLPSPAGPEVAALRAPDESVRCGSKWSERLPFAAVSNQAQKWPECGPRINTKGRGESSRFSVDILTISRPPDRPP